MILQDIIDPFVPVKDAPPQTFGRFLIWALRGSFGVIALAALLSGTVGAMEVLTALILGWVIDAAAMTTPDTFWPEKGAIAVGIALYFMFFGPAFRGVSAYVNQVCLAPNLGTQVQSRLNRWTLGQSVSFFDDDFAGRIAQKQMQTSRAVTETVVEMINVGVFAMSSLIGSAILVVAIDWRIGVVLCIWLVAYIALIRWFMPRIRKRAADRAGMRATLSGQIVDTITNVKTVKLFAHASHEDVAATNAMRDLRRSVLKFGELSSLFRLGLTSLAGVLPVLMIGGALILWANGQATEGDIAAAGAVAIRLGQMTGWVSFAMMGIYSGIGEAEDGMKTLAVPYGLTDADGATSLTVPHGRVEFKNVDFTYGSDVGGVRGLDLTIAAGEKLGIIGASGAGKSTLVSVLLRLYDVEAGEVLIDGQNVRAVTQDSLRSNIGMVTQETAMFNRSARDNILYGKPGASDDALVDAATRAEAHEFIDTLKDFKGREGYDAHLGERGVKLSGGQRQRIALARAILKDAPILVLDEATSALDSEVEAVIQAALERVMEGKTVLAIAHRLSTIARMDRIVVMDQGKIVEIGTHEALLAQDGLYARYWNRQSGGFIGIDEATT